MAEGALSFQPLNDAEDGLERCYHEISALMGRISGVQLPKNKIGLVRSRLRKRLRHLEHADFEEYLEFVQSPGGRDELSTMVDLLTTNKTSFYREPAHFDFMREEILPHAGAEMRIWCAGCSSGEEPYTLSALLHEGLPAVMAKRVRILATDLSNRVLDHAREGVYETEHLKELPRGLGQRYFRPVTDASDTPKSRVIDDLRANIRFARLNLMRPWPMKGPFDMVWCRNVMIYFDTPTREQLVQRFSQMLRPGGHLFVGHSEGLNGLEHDLTYIRPAVYRK